MQLLIPLGIFYIFLMMIMPEWFVIFLFLLPAMYVAYKYIYPKLHMVLRMQYWQRHKAELLKAGEAGYVLTLENLGLSTEGLETLREELKFNSEVVIADIDQDGFLYSRFGPISGTPNVSQDDFVQRKRRTLQVVVTDNKVGVKKYYHGNKEAFLDELEILHSLAYRCYVPAILDVNFNKLTTTISFIPGVVIREELAKGGALLRHRDLDNNPDFERLTREERNRMRIEEGRRVVSERFDQQLIEEIFTELKKIHKAGVCVGDVKYGNVIIEKYSEKPYFIDFEHARGYAHPKDLRWQFGRDHDIERFNHQFGTGKLTRERIVQTIDQFSSENSVNSDTAVNFGYGLNMGRTKDITLTERRWNNIYKPNLPSLSGIRVLDIGCRNAYYSLQMLRCGSQEVVGIEDDKYMIEKAQFVHEGFEWADSETYNFKVIPIGIEKVPTIDMGWFDIVTAFYGLQYINDERVNELISHISGITDCLIVQCDIGHKKDSLESNDKVLVDSSVKALERNGFGITWAITTPGCIWPLLIGTKV